MTKFDDGADPLDGEVGGPPIHSDDNASLTQRVQKLETQIAFIAEQLRLLVVDAMIAGAEESKMRAIRDIL